MEIAKSRGIEVHRMVGGGGIWRCGDVGGVQQVLGNTRWSQCLERDRVRAIVKSLGQL